jgi:hypothetical protein
MTKTLGIILCSAFSVGLVAETAAGVWSLANGQGISLSTAIELIIAWLVVLAVFIATIVKGFRGSPRWLGIGVTVVRPDDDDDDGSDDDSDGSDDDSDGSDDDGSDEHPADEPASDETADNAR